MMAAPEVALATSLRVKLDVVDFPAALDAAEPEPLAGADDSAVLAAEVALAEGVNVTVELTPGIRRNHTQPRSTSSQVYAQKVTPDPRRSWYTHAQACMPQLLHNLDSTMMNKGVMNGIQQQAVDCRGSRVRLSHIQNLLMNELLNVSC